MCVCVCVCVNLHPTDILGWDQVSLGCGGCPVSYKILAASLDSTHLMPTDPSSYDIQECLQTLPRVSPGEKSHLQLRVPVCVCVCVWNQVTIYSVWYLLEWLPTPVPLLGKFHGQGSLVGYSPWGHRVGHNWATNTFTFSKLRGIQYAAFYLFLELKIWVLNINCHEK